jgi:hypothetical protein
MQSDREECASLRVRLDGARAVEGGPSSACLSQSGGAASGGFHDPTGLIGEAQCGVGEARGWSNCGLGYSLEWSLPPVFPYQAVPNSPRFHNTGKHVKINSTYLHTNSVGGNNDWSLIKHSAVQHNTT